MPNLSGWKWLRLRGRYGLKYKALPLILGTYYLFGKRWNDFYTWMLDRQERAVDIDYILRNQSGPTGRERGLYDLSVADSHLQILRMAGLQPHHMLLDFGCGFGRSASTIVPYLDAGHYFGVDLSAERIRMAKEYMERLGLQDKKATFLVEPKSNDLTFLGTKRFDFIWSKAVFVHMPFANLRECLAQIRLALKDDGVFVGDIGIRDSFQKASIKDFFVTESALRKLLDETGFEFGIIKDWQIGIDDEQKYSDIWMLRLTKKPLA